MGSRNCVLFLSIFLGYLLNYFYNVYHKIGLSTVLKAYPDNLECDYHDKQIIGPEDLTRIREDIFIGISNDFVSLFLKSGVEGTAQGQIWAYYPETKTSYILEIESYPQKQNFFPQGIYFEKTTDKLHVINHAFQGEGDRIDVFQVYVNEENKKVTVKFENSLLLPIELTNKFNDILILSNGEYLLTEQQPNPSDIYEPRAQSLQSIIGEIKKIFYITISQAELSVYNCISLEKNSKNLDCVTIDNTLGEFNNGINWNGKDTVLVSDVTSKIINVYQVDFETKNRQERLVYDQEIKTNCLPDNIEYNTEQNTYIVTGLGKQHSFLDILFTQLKTYPQYADKIPEGTWTVVDRISVNDKNEYQVENILTRDGIIRGASTTLQYKNQLVLGSFMDKSFVECQYKN